MHKLAIFGAAVAIVVVGLLNIGSAFRDPVTWTPDALYYQANLLEIRGDSESEAVAKTFRGPISAELRSRDPSTPRTRTGCATASRSTSGGSRFRSQALRSTS